MKERFLNDWNWMRFLRLFLGIIATVQGFLQKEYALSLAGLFLTYMAIANIGCCGVNGCTVDYNKTRQTEKENVYEEVDTK
jgi:hypothetical protein